MRHLIESKGAPGCVLRSRLAAAAAVALMLLVRAAAAAEPPDPDACTLAAAADIETLISAPDMEVRSESNHPAPGKYGCVWSARAKGLIDTASAERTLSLDVYHFADTVKSRAQLQRLDTPPGAPRLAATDDSGDEVVYLDHARMVARHGTNVAVVGVNMQRPIWDRTDWSYRLETVALGAAGAHIRGPIDARATADVCHLIVPEHVIGLLTLTRSTLDASPGGARRCTLMVKDASGKTGGWLDNQGEAVFEREDLGNNAAALARQHSDTPFFPESHLVDTADKTDRVVPNPQRPEAVSAVHGPYLVTLQVDHVTPDARAVPGWVYRLQRAALEVAGATILPQPDLPPDPVVPGPEPKPERSAWHPAAYVPPAGSAVAAPILHVFWTLVQWRFFVLPGGIVLSLILGGTLKSRFRHAGWIAPIGILYAVLNMIFGTSAGVTLIHHYGTQAQATIVGSYATSTQYNDHDVRGYDVLIRAADGQVVETSFEDDDFNVYPSHNATTYPGQDVAFTVRYPQGFPQDFVIIADDDSPWAAELRCADLEEAADQADRKQRFAPDTPSFHAAAVAAHSALQAAGCETADDER